MKNEKEYGYFDVLRIRTPEVIAEERFMEKMNSLYKVAEDENGKFCIVCLTVAKTAPVVRKLSPKKKVTVAKKIKPKKGVPVNQNKTQAELFQALPDAVKNAIIAGFGRKSETGLMVLAMIKNGGTKEKGEAKVIIPVKKEKTAEELFMALPEIIRRNIIASFNKDAGMMTKADLLTTLPGPIVPIIPAPALGKLNCSALCARAFTVTTNITGITAFAAASPSNADVIAIMEALQPISDKGMNLSNENKILKKILFPQLRFYLGAIITSCANISYGNTVLFSGVGVAVKKSPVKHNTKLPAPQKASCNTKLGRGILGFECEVIPYAKNYCFAYGDPETDPDTWLVVVGPRNMQLPGLEPGTEYGWQMAAIGKNGVGYFSNTVVSVVPYS